MSYQSLIFIPPKRYGLRSSLGLDIDEMAEQIGSDDLSLCCALKLRGLRCLHFHIRDADERSLGGKFWTMAFFPVTPSGVIAERIEPSDQGTPEHLHDSTTIT